MSWGQSWGETWLGWVEYGGEHQIVDVGGIASEEHFGSPRLSLVSAHVVVGPFAPEIPEPRRLRITGVGGIQSEEAFGSPRIVLDENELMLLLMAA